MTKLKEIYKDYFGKKMTMITIYEKFKKVPNANNFRYLVYFKCDCGKTGYMCPRAAIKRRDCGCQSAIKRWAKRSGHGKAATPIYQLYKSMMNRCYNNNVKHYGRYGGRGIKVCKRWHKFENFYEDMGDIPSKKYSIDRIDNDGNYSKENCRWATAREQANNRSSNTKIEHMGKEYTIAELSRKIGISQRTLSSRLARGVELGKKVDKKSPRLALKIEGQHMTLMEAERKYGIKMKIISKRLKRGWSDHDAVTIKPRNNGHKKN